jgi:hypothetical protein
MTMSAESQRTVPKAFFISLVVYDFQAQVKGVDRMSDPQSS